MKPWPDKIPQSRTGQRPWGRHTFILLVALVFSVAIFLASTAASFADLVDLQIVPNLFKKHHHHEHHIRKKALKKQCKSTRKPAGPAASYDPKSRLKSGSDRFTPGTPPTVITNAKIWTGGKSGTEVLTGGSIYLNKGLIQTVAHGGHHSKFNHSALRVINAEGRWVTPGLVDLHSHLGVYSAPALRGASDGNSYKAPILPWLRSIDGLNTHDAAYNLTLSGGVTTAQILPGSANNIGGQAFLMKLRPTEERSTLSRILEPPLSLLSPELQEMVGSDDLGYIPWRHMKHACGENPSRSYSQTRMDSGWNFRNAYNEARKIKLAQDAYCDRVENGDLPEESFPESLEWEALVDVLRGKVKLSVHCYEAVDLDAIVRLSNEFQFPVASFHHAGETYLVPDLLKKTWGGPPAAALFASNARKKREAYRGSEFAPRILAENGIPVVMKSDHPVLNSRYLLFEAQLAHYYGLDPALALSSVTTVPAAAAGVGQRVGQIKEGYDADVVIWDSHPLSLGATPVQVWIDGIPQLEAPHILRKSLARQTVPSTPDWDKEKNETVRWEGLPPLAGKKGFSVNGQDGHVYDAVSETQNVRFSNVTAVYSISDSGNVVALYEQATEVGVTSPVLPGVDVVINDGDIVCIGYGGSPCPKVFGVNSEELVIDLQGGVLAPGLTTFGSPLGLVEIHLEPSTADGNVRDPLTQEIPSILGTDENASVVRALDGLQFQGRNSLLAYRGGVTKAITPPTGDGFLYGLSTAFDLGASHALEKGAIVQEEVALHVRVDLGMDSSVSTQIALLRHLLHLEDRQDPTPSDWTSSSQGAWARVREGFIPLVIEVESADIMATLIRLKNEYEDKNKRLKMTFTGASEAHIIAKQIAWADVSVVITSPRPYPGTWSSQRILAGPPLTQKSNVKTLLDAGVNVAIGVVDEFAARNTRFELGWLSLDGGLSTAQTLGLATVNLERALGVQGNPADFVAYRGGSVFDFESKVVSVLSLRKRTSVSF
ncbi:hypothetical protein BDN72DRAFT_836217 [Pluteus cervinus]|uniref:Uncharacterized protein n=1 Tax=Pluteus cervinus TaxID=181527 RepID=A0ACD3B486_9AGAR|nr:hypothetical protein BDN72DRAFT_836217 [Pluteus cervinus]